MSEFDLSRLTPPQRSLIESTLARCRYDFARLLPRLRERWGKAAIEVLFSDLSRFNAVARATGGDMHVHDSDGPDGVVGHPIESRARVLGLAWTNGRIELDLSLESQPELAAEVFLSEGAHESDWFDPAMDAGRERIWDAMHPGEHGDIGAHGHSWFDVGAYETWAGEAWMGLFTAATSDVKVTLTQFVHKVTPEGIAVAREVLGIGTKPAPYFATRYPSRVFHDSHKRLTPDRRFEKREDAISLGLRPCGVCKP